MSFKRSDFNEKTQNTKKIRKTAKSQMKNHKILSKLKNTFDGEFSIFNTNNFHYYINNDNDDSENEEIIKENISDNEYIIECTSSAECHSKPLIFFHSNNDPINLKCPCQGLSIDLTNSHSPDEVTEIKISNYLKKSKELYKNLKCTTCAKKYCQLITQKNKEAEENDEDENKEKFNFYYCVYCNKFFCRDCKISHENDVEKRKNNIIIEGKHPIMNMEDLSSICWLHKENYYGYCKDCKENICSKCYNEKKHNTHNVIMFNKILMSEQNIIDIKNKLLKEKKNWNFIEKVFNTSLTNLKKKFYSLLNIKKDISKLKEILIFEYEKHSSNYQTIMSCKKLEFENKNIIFNKKTTDEYDLELITQIFGILNKKLPRHFSYNSSNFEMKDYNGNIDSLKKNNIEEYNNKENDQNKQKRNKSRLYNSNKKTSTNKKSFVTEENIIDKIKKNSLTNLNTFQNANSIIDKKNIKNNSINKLLKQKLIKIENDFKSNNINNFEENNTYSVTSNVKKDKEIEEEEEEEEEEDNIEDNLLFFPKRSLKLKESKDKSPLNKTENNNLPKIPKLGEEIIMSENVKNDGQKSHSIIKKSNLVYQKIYKLHNKRKNKWQNDDDMEIEKPKDSGLFNSLKIKYKYNKDILGTENEEPKKNKKYKKKKVENKKENNNEEISELNNEENEENSKIKNQKIINKYTKKKSNKPNGRRNVEYNNNFNRSNDDINLKDDEDSDENDKKNNDKSDNNPKKNNNKILNLKNDNINISSIKKRSDLIKISSKKIKEEKESTLIKNHHPSSLILGFDMEEKDDKIKKPKKINENEDYISISSSLGDNITKINTNENKFQNDIYEKKNIEENIIVSSQLETTIRKKIDKKGRIYSLKITNDPVWCLLSYKNNEYVAVGLASGAIKFFSQSDYEQKLNIEEHVGAIYSMFQSKTNINCILTSSTDKTIKKIYISDNLSSYKVIEIYKGHKSSVYKAIELFNNQIVSCSDDGSLIIWGNFNANTVYNLRKNSKGDNKFSITNKKNDGKNVSRYSISTSSLLSPMRDSSLENFTENNITKVKLIKDNSDVNLTTTNNNNKLSVGYNKTSDIMKHNQKLERANSHNKNLFNKKLLSNFLNKGEVVYDILQINDEIFVTSSLYGFLRFWDIKSQVNINTIKDIQCNDSHNNLCIINKSILGVLLNEKCGIALIDYINKEVIHKIIVDKDLEIKLSTILLTSNKLVVIGGQNNVSNDESQVVYKFYRIVKIKKTSKTGDVIFKYSLKFLNAHSKKTQKLLADDDIWLNAMVEGSNGTLINGLGSTYMNKEFGQIDIFFREIKSNINNQSQNQQQSSNKMLSARNNKNDKEKNKK